MNFLKAIKLIQQCYVQVVINKPKVDYMQNLLVLILVVLVKLVIDNELIAAFEAAFEVKIKE